MRAMAGEVLAAAHRRAARSYGAPEAGETRRRQILPTDALDWPSESSFSSSSDVADIVRRSGRNGTGNAGKHGVRGSRKPKFGRTR